MGVRQKYTHFNHKKYLELEGGCEFLGHPMFHIEINSVQEGPYSMASMGNTTATGALFKSSKVMHKDLPHMKIADT